MKIIITGSSGMIGSHLFVLLNNIKGYLVKGLDINSSEYTNYQGDILDVDFLDNIFNDFRPDIIIHLAALIKVNESQQYPEKYKDVNVKGTQNLIKMCQKYNINNFIFSSTGAIYGNQQCLNEGTTPDPQSVYAETKLEAEKSIIKYCQDNQSKAIILRFFNVTGGFLKVNRCQSHLLPSILDAMKNNRPIEIFGNNYPTKDGTCIRDYIDVEDVCNAIIRCLEYINIIENGQVEIFNLGSGIGYSVLEVINTASLLPNYNIKEPRIGDPPLLVADISKAIQKLDWKPNINLELMIKRLAKSLQNN